MGVKRTPLYWLDNKTADRLLIALADGDLRWDHATNDFDWRATGADRPFRVRAALGCS